MVKHNNVIPNVHLRKHWQKNVRVWLNQAGRKKRRLTARRAKAEAAGSRPLDKLRPVVKCATNRYNHRNRVGRGTSSLRQDSLSQRLRPLELASNSPDPSESQSTIGAGIAAKSRSNSTKIDSKII